MTRSIVTFSQRSFTLPRALGLLLFVSVSAAACGSNGSTTSAVKASAPDSGAPTGSVAPTGSAAPTGSVAPAGSVAVPKVPWKVLMIGALNPAGNPFVNTLKCAGQKEASTLGSKVVHFDFQAPVDYSAPEQITLLRNALAVPPDALVIEPADSKALQRPLEEAMKAGVKDIIILDTVTSNVGAFTASIVSDDENAGSEASAFLAKISGNKGSVVAFGTAPGIATTQRRLAGFSKGIASTKLSELTVEYDQGEASQAAQLTSGVIAGNSSLVGIFDTGGTAYTGIQNAVRQTGKAGKLHIIAFDTYPDRVTSLKAGTLAAIIGQSITQEGILGVQFAVQALSGTTVPKQTVLPTKLITPENVNSPEVTEKYILTSTCGA